ncbi:MAG: CHAT domain-containing protein [Caldilineaceae bacterium]|nr:CHAT domain-containing protein [Caldilineaceae bacterium]
MDSFWRMVEAVRALGPELPSLIGEADWPQFKTALERLIAEAGADPSQTSTLYDQLLQLFSGYPDAYHRLLELAARGEAQAVESTPDAPVPEGIADNSRSAARGARPRTLVRYTDISCPRRVWVETPRISVVVRLTVTPHDQSAAAVELTLREDLPVQVRIDAPQFDLLNEPVQEVTLPPDRDSPPLVFDLRPRAVGHTQITFDFLQNGQPLRAVSVAVEITPYSVAEGAEPTPAHPLRVEPDAAPPDLVLHIAWDAASSQLVYTLIRAGGAWWRTFAPVTVNGNPAAYAAQLYARITKSTRSVSKRRGQRHLGSERELAREDVDRHLRKLGQSLWGEVIPPDLKALYAQERGQWRDRSLLIFSDEPYLPWELVWPYDETAGAWEDDGPWCGTLDLTRWLRKDERGNGNEMAPTRLTLHKLTVLAPTYTRLDNLPAAQRERQTLIDLAQSHQVESAGPAEPTWRGVLDFLEDGGYDWVHVAAHGSFYPQAPDGDSALWLQEDHALSPQDLSGAAIRRAFVQHRPGFFFNACEVGRQGWTLTRIGGWANRLVSTGAGLFVGPQWAVQDAAAAAFAQAFYAALLDGATVAAATRQARRKAQTPGDPTWLAYSVYSHPNARLA